jgi:hypothetical protein
VVKKKSNVLGTHVPRMSRASAMEASTHVGCILLIHSGPKLTMKTEKIVGSRIAILVREKDRAWAVLVGRLDIRKLG